jgi:hypothetical protein
MTIDCIHNLDELCEIATEIAHKPCKILTTTCQACVLDQRPKRLNVYTMSLALVYEPELDIPLLESVIDNTSNAFGTRLANTLGILFQESPDCPCPGRKDILDTWTPDYIKANLDYVVGWLQQEAMRRRLPFFRPFARILLLGLLRISERNI